jgi:CRP-like cAMP-binding protein
VPLEDSCPVIGRKAGQMIVSDSKKSYLGIMHYDLKQIIDAEAHVMATIGLPILRKIFCFLEDLAVQSFLKFARFKHLEQGEVIYKKGDKVKDYIIVCSGSLKTKAEAKI